VIDLPAELRSAITRFVAENPASRFPGSADPFFDEPLAGFAAADDPLWSDFKNIIGGHHLTPTDPADS